ncbi:MAG TPA: hypothetical protein VEO20_08340 [Thermoplasmata archaeon]|nr:hypothetical protein [Thermoplasmata archaeon]
MRKSTAVALAAIVLGAIAVRLSPLWSFLYWGSDTAEYFSILRGLVRTGHVSTIYPGWGVTYPFFPGVFFPQAGLAELGGLDVPTVLNLLVPVLGSFAVVPMFLLAVRITKEDRMALFAAAFLAGAIPHVYTTAHSAPATLGDLLALTGLLLFLRLRTDARSMAPLLLVSGTLVVTHHLSLYFFLLMVLGAIVVRGLARPWTLEAQSRRELAFAAVLIVGSFAYWFGYATAFRESILPDVNVQPWWLLFVLFSIGLLVLALLVAARRRIRWRYRPTLPGLRSPLMWYVVAAGTLLIVGTVTILGGVPGTSFRVPAEGLLSFVPLALLMSFSASGRKFLDLEREGIHPNAWLVALLLSAVVGIAFAPRVIIPYRHAEYLMIPFAIFAGVGFFRILDLVGLRGGRRNVALAVCGAVLLANVFAGIPPPSTLAGWREGTIPAALDPAYWARDHASGLVVSDHQGSSTVFGFGGIDATWDRTRDPFLPQFATDPYAGLVDINAPSGVRNGTYVWIDRDMESGVRLTPWETAVAMDPSVIAKFDAAPFVKVFDNGYARLYWIDWGCTPTTC